MPNYNEFIQSLLPGNYALTKSMEMTKVTDSGTLWYTKKFLTLYYYVFLSNDIDTEEYKQAVIDIFDNYINSLPEEIRERANQFFYPEQESINFKSENFNLFVNFASCNVFANQKEKTKYLQSAKKYYFSLLMGSGGQTGVKKKLKEAVQQQGFVYSQAKIDEIILNSAISECTQEVNDNKSISDNSIKHVLSKETMERACQTGALRIINEDEIRQLNEEYPHQNPKYRGIENDMVAFIRNERQILYYYGYFHSKSSGANDFEFSSLTPIGELALKANADEFQLIWEHQKIKMISQPVIADVNDIPAVANPPTNFGISYTPYTDILGCISRRGSLSLEEYKYIISRKKHCWNEEEWKEDENVLIDRLADIKQQVNDFGRRGDKADEDGRKELLKYLLGIRMDIPLDGGFNQIGILKLQNSTVTVEKEDALELLYSTYLKLDKYKVRKYETVFADSEADLRTRYVESMGGGAVSATDGRVKIYWDLYNMQPDKFIMLSSAIAYSATALGIYDIENASRRDISAISQYISEKFNNLFKMFGIRTLTAVKKEVRRAVLALTNDDFSDYIDANEMHAEIMARYRYESAADLFARIERISESADVNRTATRERNSTLVSLLKSYYMVRYAEDGMLKCECCGEETFLTSKGEAYVEFHHLIPFKIAYGPDHYLNLFALCPNCHRKFHFLSVDNKEAEYVKLNDNNYLHKHFTERLRELRGQNLLRSYHLEFLLADKAITLEEYNSIAA